MGSYRKNLRAASFSIAGGTLSQAAPRLCQWLVRRPNTPAEFAERGRDVVVRGYKALKFDPFGIAWREMSPDESDIAVERVAQVREAVGRDVQLMIEFHGRLSYSCAAAVMRRLEPYLPAWCEEPISPERIELLAELRRQTRMPIAAGERLMTEADFDRLIRQRAADIVQMDICHCGGLAASKKIAASAAVQDLRVAHTVQSDRLPWRRLYTSMSAHPTS